MKSAEHKSLLATVSTADREYIKRLADANAVASRGDGPAGTLAEALDRMWRIERAMGIDVVAIAQEHWTDYDSHIAYLEAVRKMAAKKKSTQVEFLELAG